MIHAIFQLIAIVSLAILTVVVYNMSAVPTSNIPPNDHVEPLHQDISATTTATTSASTTASSTPILETPIKTIDETESESKDPDSDTIPEPEPQEQPIEETKPQNNSVSRVENPYPFAPKSADTLNTDTRAALVNILCQTSAGSLYPISGSGVIIDPKGVILTNAHVAQYLLLSTRPEMKLTCDIRTGSPAKFAYKASILFMPSAWVDEHAADIRATKPMGTGEHDYALLVITDTTDGSPLPPQFPYIPVDSREAIGFVGDTTLLAAYPAEFTGGITTQRELYAASAYTQIRELLTFTESDVDLISLGGVIVAQSGSSGGAVVNQWGRLIGIITTTSDGASTVERDLRAITLAYVDRALQAHARMTLAGIIAGDVRGKSINFMSYTAPALADRIAN